MNYELCSLLKQFQLARLNSLLHRHTKISGYPDILVALNLLATEEKVPVTLLIHSGLVIEGTTGREVFQIAELQLQQLYQHVALHGATARRQLFTKTVQAHGTCGTTKGTAHLFERLVTEMLLYVATVFVGPATLDRCGFSACYSISCHSINVPYSFNS